MSSLENQRRKRAGSSVVSEWPTLVSQLPLTCPPDAAGSDRLADLRELAQKAVETLGTLRGKITPRAVDTLLRRGSALRCRLQVNRGTAFGIVLPVEL